MGLTRITPATTTPVSVAEVKAYCRIEGSDEDSLVEVLLKSAVSTIGERIGRPLAPEGWQLVLDQFSDAIELGKAPVTAVAEVGYTDPDGLPQVVDPAVYSLDLVSQPQWVVRNEGQVWPDVLAGVNVVSVEFTVGYTAGTIPAELKLAVLQLAEHWYSNRGTVNVGNIVNDLPFTVEDLIAPYRTLWICA